MFTLWSSKKPDMLPGEPEWRPTYWHNWGKWLWQKDKDVPEEVTSAKTFSLKLFLKSFSQHWSHKKKMLEADPNLGVWQFAKKDIEEMVSSDCKLHNQKASIVQTIHDKYFTKKWNTLFFNVPNVLI